MNYPDPGQVRTIAVIGAGTIGASWAAWFLARGYDVVASDPARDGEAAMRRLIDAAWPSLERLGLDAGARRDRVRFVGVPLEAARLGDVVQESAPERLELKQALLAELDAVLPPERVIASSTSGFTVSA